MYFFGSTVGCNVLCLNFAAILLAFVPIQEKCSNVTELPGGVAIVNLETGEEIFLVSRYFISNNLLAKPNSIPPPG